MITSVFKINEVVYDGANKEYVKLTNGTDDGGVFVPTEGIALRLIGINSNNKPMIGFTYRKVNVADLWKICEPSTSLDFNVLSNDGPHWENVGRI